MLVLKGIFRGSPEITLQTKKQGKITLKDSLGLAIAKITEFRCTGQRVSLGL